MDYRKRFVLLVGLMFLLTLIELFAFNRQYIAQRFSQLEQRRLRVRDGILKQIRNERGILVSQGTDPSITFEHLNQQITSISIACSTSIATASGQLFYRSVGEPFSAQNSIWYKPTLDGGEIVLFLPKTQLVSDLKVDLTNCQGDVMTCQNFVINPPIKFGLAATRLILYLCVIALVMLELFKDVDARKTLLSALSDFQSRAPKTSWLLPLGWSFLWLIPWASWLDARPWLRSGLQPSPLHHSGHDSQRAAGT